MKKILLFCTVVILTSCSGFLDEEPRTERVQDQYFTSASHAYSVVNKLYRSGVHDLYNAGSAYNGPKMMSGGYMSGFFDNPKYKGMEQFIVNCQDMAINPQSSGNYLDAIWDPCYAAIGRANLAIQKIPGTPGLSEAEQNQLLAESYFFRAFNYFTLVKFFGGVPLIPEPYVSLEGLYVARASLSDLYSHIVADLTFALNEGGLGEKAMPSNGFRISKGSVGSLLADVYLTMSGYPLKSDNYSKAATTVRNMVATTAYGLIQHDPGQTAYDKMRTSEIEKEYMYVLEYKANIAESFWAPVYCYPPDAVTWPGNIFKYSITADVYLPSEEYLSMYDSVNDLRIQEKQFFHSSLTYQYKDKNDVIQTEIKKFPTLPYLWHDATALFLTGRPDKDVAVYRFAEVLLIGAEAIALSEGVTAEAIGYLADVRDRAITNKTRAQIVTELTGLSVDNFVQEVWKERLREFPLEFKLWSDIQRTRKIMVTNKNDKGNVSFTNIIGHTSTWGRVFQEKNLLYPISYNEIQRNPALVQNDH